MNKILYSATTPSNTVKNGYIDARSNKEALATLTKAGFTDIIFHDDTSIGFARKDLANFNEKQLARTAVLEIKVRNGVGKYSLWIAVLRENRFTIALGLLSISVGLIVEIEIGIWFGIVLVSAVPLAYSWANRHTRRYNRLLAYFAMGKWEKSQKLITQLKNSVTIPDILFDLDIREGAIEALNGNLTKALELAESWREKTQHHSPGFYESRVASIYHAGKNYTGFVDSMRQAYEKSPDNASRTLDYALAEARLGDIHTAEKLVSTINNAELPIYGRPFLIWVKGIIALKSDNQESLDNFHEATNDLIKYKNNPAVWTTLAVVSGYLALALYKQRRIHEANTVLESVWPILAAHADMHLLEELNSYVTA